MKNTHRYGLTLVIVCLMTMLGACQKKEDELVLVTTEATTTEAVAVTTTEAVVDEDATEEAIGRENSMSFEDLYQCNKGDALLAGGVSYGMNTIYYSGDEEKYSEYQFLGFDDAGMYAQVYEDSNGRVEILDAANSYWYVIEDNQLSVLLYPEPLVAAAIIDSNHNSMIFGLASTNGSAEVVTDVYRKSGKLMVETEYSNVSGEGYMLEYTLDDSWKVEEFYCYDKEGGKVSYSLVTAGATYEIPEMVTEAMAMEEGYRTVSIVYVDGDQMDISYYTPQKVPVQLSTLEYVAYSDQACSAAWNEIEPDENGVYKDVTIYMKKSSVESTEE